MMAMVEKSCEVIEMGSRQCLEATEESDGSLSFSDAEDHSWHSRCEDCQCSGASGHDLEEFPEVCWKSCVSDCSLEGDLEKGVLEIKESSEEVEKDCRICHLSLVSASPQSGIPIVLGCSCKDDLGDAHKQCAETWFKIKGNTICEICGSTARNIVGPAETEFLERWNEATNSTAPPARPAEAPRFLHGHHILNFILACMVLAFVISWLFRFNAPD
ncbi:uncharacterized protein [Typha latifolia]|uniref:uncharacterized protein isoform X1 n=1 Tax=Typha latifolia TaxID=4733 RepID=UPI003C2CB83D